MSDSEPRQPCFTHLEDLITLCRTIWHGDAWSPSILIDTATGNHSSDRVVVFECLLQSLEDYDTTSLASSITGPSLVEGKRSARFPKESAAQVST